MSAHLPRPRLLSSLALAAAFASATSAQSCDPQVTFTGNPCICSTVTYSLTDNPGCFDFLVISFEPTPLSFPGFPTLPASPPYFVVAAGFAPLGFAFDIPCQIREIGVPVVAFGVALDANFDLYVSPPASFEICGGELGDRVWCDTNNDGMQDPGEPGLAGVQVTVDCGPGYLPQTATTDSLGNYLISDLPLLSCMVSVDLNSAPLRKVPGLNCAPELDVDLAIVGPTYLDADFCFVDCNPCKGGVTKLRLRYTGITTANITVFDSGNQVVFSGTVEPQDTFAFAGVQSDGKLGSRTTVVINGMSTEIHTSCSQPIGPGSVIGNVTVVAGESKDRGPLCPPSPCEDGKPCSLTLRYTGKSCAATHTSQDPSKVSCSGDPAFASPVRILSTDDEDPNKADAKVWFDGLVNLDESFTLESYNAGESKLASATFVYVFDTAGNLLQSVEFHTSCSQPLIFGDEYGSVLLEGFWAEGQCNNPNLCGGGDKPCSLTLRYTGDGCAATSHHQDPSKVSCSGDPNFAPMVHIRATDDEDPSASNAKVWFDGQVLLNDTFELLASAANENRLENETHVYVFDLAGNLLQAVEFHTSCSQPLMVDDQFGSLRLEGFVPEGQCGGGGSGGASLCNGGKPQTVTMIYTGQNCAASSNAQDPSKWDCSGDPAMASLVSILVTDNADPLSSSAHVWFQGVVDLNMSFVISALNANATRLASNTYVYIYDGTTLVQSVRFHTSCSQPLRVDDQWGSMRLVGLTLE